MKYETNSKADSTSNNELVMKSTHNGGSGFSLADASSGICS
jgi:hypothetical protein